MTEVDDEQFQREVQKFAERYLFSALNEAATNEEDATIAVFALM